MGGREGKGALGDWADTLLTRTKTSGPSKPREDFRQIVSVVGIGNVGGQTALAPPSSCCLRCSRSRIWPGSKLRITLAEYHSIDKNTIWSIRGECVVLTPAHYSRWVLRHRPGSISLWQRVARLQRSRPPMSRGSISIFARSTCPKRKRMRSTRMQSRSHPAPA